MNKVLSSHPALNGTQAATAPTASGNARSAHRTLADLMSDGFYMLLLLKRGQLPNDLQAFTATVKAFLENVERNAIRLGLGSENIYAAKYAFCAAIDEAILTQPSPLRVEWERHPLQLSLFGDHIAGENFFVRLEELRARGAPRLQALEVYYYMLLLGFEGKYRIEGTEKLGFLTARLGDEIAYLKGQKTSFAPHWEPPDRVTHALRRHLPFWTPAAALAVAAVVGYFVIADALKHDTQEQLLAYQDIVQLPPRTAHLVITLP